MRINKLGFPLIIIGLLIAMASVGFGEVSQEIVPGAWKGEGISFNVAEDGSKLTGEDSIDGYSLVVKLSSNPSTTVEMKLTEDIPIKEGKFSYKFAVDKMKFKIKGNFAAADSILGSVKYKKKADSIGLKWAASPITSPIFETGFLIKTCLSEGSQRSYSLYVPGNYTPDRKWPLIIFQHGSGESGKDGSIQTMVGLGPVIRLHPDWFPCLVLFPQVSFDGHNPWEAAYGRTIAKYNIDPNRVSMTGLSQGGFATWKIGATHTGIFSCLMPICGGGSPFDASKLAKIPIWAFHGNQDMVVKPDRSRIMVNAIQEEGGNITYTEYPEVGHDCWEITYSEKKHIDWLLENKR